MQQLNDLKDSQLIELFPISESCDLPSRQEMDATLKRAINVSWRDKFSIPERFIEELEDDWRVLASQDFIKNVATRMFLESKKPHELELDQNRVFQKQWRLMTSEFNQYYEVSSKQS